ncbi:MAG: DUF389 domain-containing protein [Lactovum sp.]
MESTNYTASEFREKINLDLKIKMSDSIILMCAIVIAAVGLNMNSVAVIIGAMLISPLMTPILGIGYGLSVLDFQIVKEALNLLLVEVSVSIAVATIYFWLSPISYPSTEIIARTAPTMWDVLIAFSGGVAGIIGARKKGSNNIVPGVAIATALMPPVCTIGYSIATTNLNYFIGSSYLFIINCSFIMIATFIGVRFMKFPLRSKIRDKKYKKVNTFLILCSLLIIIPSIFTASSLVRESFEKTAVTHLVEEEFSDYIVLNQSYNKEKKTLVLTVSGEKISSEKIEKIQNEMSDYGLDDVMLDIDQVPDMSELSGSEFTQYLDQYIKNKLEEENTKKITIMPRVEEE